MTSDSTTKTMAERAAEKPDSLAVPDSVNATLSAAIRNVSSVFDVPDSVLSGLASTRVIDVDSTSNTGGEPSWDIEVDAYATQEKVAHYMNLFLGTARGRFVERLQRGKQYEPMIREKFRAAGIPEDNFAWPMQLMGRDIDRFRAAAPNCAVWMIEQAFSYPDLLPQHCSHFPGGPPSRDELRFMAWQAIHHGTTGLFWYGSYTVKRPSPFMDDLMAVVSELRQTVDFVQNGPVPGITAEAHHTWRPSIMGCSCTVWRLGDRVLVFMINEDAHSVDMHIRGLDDVVQRGLVPVNEPSADLTPLDGGYVTPMRGHEVRLYLAG